MKDCRECHFHKERHVTRHGYCSIKEKNISYPGYEPIACNHYAPKEEVKEAQRRT